AAAISRSVRRARDTAAWDQARDALAPPLRRPLVLVDFFESALLLAARAAAFAPLLAAAIVGRAKRRPVRRRLRSIASNSSRWVRSVIAYDSGHPNPAPPSHRPGGGQERRVSRLESAGAGLHIRMYANSVSRGTCREGRRANLKITKRTQFGWQEHAAASPFTLPSPRGERVRRCGAQPFAPSREGGTRREAAGG